MGTTANKAYRYPDATDRVADGALAMQHLAEDVDAATRKVRARAYLGAGGQNLASGTALTAIILDTETAGDDTEGLHSTAALTNRFTITATTAGVYVVTAQISFAPSANGQRAMAVRKNGAGANLVILPAAGTSNHYQQASAIYDLAAGDYVELVGWQNSGAALALNPTYTWMEAVRVAS